MLKQEENQSLPKLEGFDKPTIWSKFTHLANETKSVNLGQGFPDWQPPKFFKELVFKHCTNNAFYQYTRNFGVPLLVESIARNYEKSFGRNINPLTEIFVANGAVNVLYLILTALVHQGDEVVLLEPFYDCYLPQVVFSGGKVVGVPMNPPKKRPRSDFQKITKDMKDDWTVDFDALEKAFNSNTKVLLLNTPNNPTGKIFSYDELRIIAKILEKFPRVVVIMDEVYEFHIGENKELPRFVTLPGMFDRTITVLSAGKIFSATGIRIGWGIGPNSIIKQINPVLQCSTFCISDPIQNVIADCLDYGNKPFEGYENYYSWIGPHFLKHRNYLIENLSKITNLDVDYYLPEGGFFLIADISRHKPETKHFLVDDDKDKDLVYTKDYKFLLNLSHDYKVVGIPCSPFYTKEHKHLGENFIRFAFCKEFSTLDKAFANLSKNNK